MIQFGRFIAKHRVLILVLAVLLLIPSVLGYAATRVNYDVLTYLPGDIDTMVGQDILMDQFGKGGFSLVVVEGLDSRGISSSRTSSPRWRAWPMCCPTTGSPAAGSPRSCFRWTCGRCSVPGTAT